MNRILTFLGLASASLVCFAEPSSAGALCTPKTFTPISNYSTSLSACDNAILSMSITSKASGVSGFSSDQLANAIAGADNHLVAYDPDRFSQKYGASTISAQQDTSFSSGTEAYNITTLAFTRSLKTDDFNLANGNYYLLWMYGTTDNILYYESAKQKLSASTFKLPAVPASTATWLFLSGLLGVLRLKCSTKN
jgi:hypothetical protein